MTTSITRRIGKLIDDPTVKGAEINEALGAWVIERNAYMKSKLDWMESCIDKKNHEGYRIAFNQLKASIDQDKATQQKLFALLTNFE